MYSPPPPLLDRHNDLLRFVHPHRISFHSAVAKQCLPRRQIELPRMQRTDQCGSADQAVGEGPAAMGTFGLDRKNRSVSRAKHGYSFAACREIPALTGRDGADAP